MSKILSTKTLWTLLALVLCSLAEICQGNSLKAFPDNFKFGTATAAYQVEGGWNASDKTPNIWDHACHTEPWKILNEDNGDIACDSYHKYKRDVEMLRELGVDFYRFSVSWSRVLPTGFANKMSEDGVAYYNNLINELLKYNIEPVLTMYHWDLPQRLQDLGGWTNPLISNWFEDYARVLFEQFGDRVKTWITINEPHTICFYGYGATQEMTYLPPYVNLPGVAEYLCSYNILRSHARAYHVYNDEFKSIQQGRVGISVHMLWTMPASETPDNIQAAADYFECRSELYLHPIFSTNGNFPSNCIQKVAAKSAAQGFPKSRLPVFTAEEILSIKGSADFMGVNHYTTLLVYRNSSLKGLHPEPSWLDDIDTATAVSTEWPSTASAWFKVAPWGFREVLNYLSTKYGNVEMIITENGFSSRGGLDDDDRVDYYREYLDALLDAILVDGINVTGYTAWALMDNFEWNSGYSEHFGLYEVDFDDPERARTARKSALIFKEIIRSRVIDTDYVPSSLDISIFDPIL